MQRVTTEKERGDAIYWAQSYVSDIYWAAKDLFVEIHSADAGGARISSSSAMVMRPAVPASEGR